MVCSSQSEADAALPIDEQRDPSFFKMTEFFAEHGIRSANVHTGPTGAPRARSLEMLRDGELDVVLRGLDPCLGSGEGSVVYGLGSDRCVDGLRLQELNPQLAEYFGAEEGVLVTEVLEGSSLGVRAGDVIRSIGGRTVEDAEDVHRILRSYETDEPVEIVVVRRGEPAEVRGTRRRP